MALSREGRRAISLAQQRRWAKYRTTGKPKRQIPRVRKVRIEVLDAYKTLGRFIKRQAL